MCKTPFLTRRQTLAGAAALPLALGWTNPVRASDFSSLQATLDRAVASGQVPGLVALIARGPDVWTHVAGLRDIDSGAPMTRDTLFAVASIGKPLTAVAALMLVQDGTIGLDDPVDPWLPELADRHVLRQQGGALDDTVPATRAITLRDLLTMRMGLGIVFADPAEVPVAGQMQALGVMPGPTLFAEDADTYMARLGSLPLMHQPGAAWRYHTGLDVAGVLVARASGMSLDEFLRARVCAPLGMQDTAFSGPADRLATQYAANPDTGALERWNSAAADSFADPPVFQAGGGGHVSSVDDFLAFGRFLLAGGMADGGRLLDAALVDDMLRDQITPAQKAASPWFPADFWDTHGWGLGVAIRTAPQDAIGRFGWWGGYGTSFWCDPASDTVAALFTQRMMTGPDDVALADAFTHAAFDAR
ncbi:serine hydrolase [Roseinatronobacter sp. S2]|uniref:serine hydrolase domain-containing protein n=1 Tax=Roseinatronobacter sp. S2 TaxID=3035471 RepID=UPI00240F9D20|nr:serine hydrolase domain-containing protein [Roseinatronobacter sp. S2]WFE77051.1 serine hydrolase [Roseinatronobacter sp. S2]